MATASRKDKGDPTAVGDRERPVRSPNRDSLDGPGKPAAGGSAAGADGRTSGAPPDRAGLRESILAGVAMLGRKEACSLLGLSGADPSAAMRMKEGRGELLGLLVRGRIAYPLFQFDVEGGRVHPTMGHIMAAKPPGWSGLRLLYWLTRPHLDLGRTPAEAMHADGGAVLEAFRREIQPPSHG